MNRRYFLTVLGAGVAGIALEQAVPLGRVWSFPKKIVIGKPLDLRNLFSIGDVVTVEQSGGLIDPLQYFVVQAVTEIDCYLYPSPDLGSGLQLAIVPYKLLRPAPFFPTPEARPPRLPSPS